jgi:hypothetical protein
MPRMRLIALLREPADRAHSEYTNKLADGTVWRYVTQRYGATPMSRADREVAKPVPTWPSLVAASTRASRSTCDGAPAALYTFYDDRDKGAERCYVNSFVMGSCYARYLRAWLDVFGPEPMLLLDQDELMASPANATARAAAHGGRPARRGGAAAFAAVEGKVYNTRFNRGVHSAPGSRIGGVAHAIAADEIAARTSAAAAGPQHKSDQVLLRDELIACALAAFYAPHNRELLELLDVVGQAPMEWARRGAAESDDPCPCLRNVAKRNYAQLEQSNSLAAHTLGELLSAARCSGSSAASTAKVPWLPASPAPPAEFSPGDPRAG